MTADGSPGPPGSPHLPAKQVALLALVACGLSLAMNLSFTTNPGKVPADAADRYLQSWQMAWNGHALFKQPWDFFDSNTFWPLENSVAFSDALLGFTPAGLIGSGPEAAIVRYNLVFLFTYALAFFAAALLARELGVTWPVALLAAAAFAFAPWRLAHHNHLHVLASGPIPLTLFLLLRGYRRRRPGLVLFGFVVAAWQVSLGFTLGIPLVYLLGCIAVLAAFRWWRAGFLPRLSRRMVAATAAGAVVLFSWSGLQAAPYLEVLGDHQDAQRSEAAAAFFSPPPGAFTVTPPESVVWGEITRERRQGMAWPAEMALFPGLTVLLLAVAGLALPVFSRGWRTGLAVAVVLPAILAMGYEFFDGRFTYGLLYDLAPGWKASRTPGRLFTLTSLALALLAAAGAQGLAARNWLRTQPRRSGGARNWLANPPARPGNGNPLPIPAALPGNGDPLPTPPAPPRPRAWLVVPLLLTGLVLAEGLGRPGELSDPEVRSLPAAGPQLHLPSSEFDDLLYVFWSTSGFPEIVNGYSGFTPELLSRLRVEVSAFPDAASVDRLREMGVRMVVIHPDLALGTVWEGAHERPIAGLGIERRSNAETVVFDLGPVGPGASR